MDNAPIGQSTKPAKNNTSTVKKNIIRKISARITKVLMNIPIKIENPTNPSLYSFFQGLKYVFTKRVKENKLRNALLREPKNLKIPKGASQYQNFKNIKGRLK